MSPTPGQREPDRLVDQLGGQEVAGRLAGDGRQLDAVERHGDLLALRRDGRRIDAEVRIDRDQKTRALDDIAGLEGVQEARWNR